MCEINAYVKMKAEKLKEKMKAGVSLCGYRSLRFDNGNLPDYNDDIVQDVYAIRYSMAYAFEYEKMYKSLLPRLQNKDKLEVVSFGCGTMIDYWSLKQVLPESCHVCYHGVDVIDWKDKFPCYVGDTVDFSQKSISGYLESCDTLTADVYMFPKSISELDEYEIDKICQIFCDKHIMKKEVHLLFSLRASNDNEKQDLQKTTKIYKNMSSLKMVSSDNWHKPDRDTNDMIYFNNHKYDVYDLKEAYGLLCELTNRCKNYSEGCYACQLCKQTRNKPILTRKYIRYQIFTFRKAA